MFWFVKWVFGEKLKPQNLISLEIEGEDQEKITRVINRAMKEVQKKAAKKMMEQGGGLGGLLGGMGQ